MLYSPLYTGSAGHCSFESFLKKSLATSSAKNDFVSWIEFMLCYRKPIRHHNQNITVVSMFGMCLQLGTNSNPNPLVIYLSNSGSDSKLFIAKMSDDEFNCCSEMAHTHTHFESYNHISPLRILWLFGVF